MWIGARWLWSVVAGKLSSRQIYARARASQVRSSAVRMLPDATTRLDIATQYTKHTQQSTLTLRHHTHRPNKSPQSWRHRPKQPAWARSELQASSSCCTCANRCQSVEVSLAYGHSKRPLLTVPGLEWTRSAPNSSPSHTAPLSRNYARTTNTTTPMSTSNWSAWDTTSAYGLLKTSSLSRARLPAPTSARSRR